MKNKEMFSSKYEIKILLIIVIILQSLIYIKAGIDKSYIHMDEAYSLGLASYDKVEIQDNEDFYNMWHNKEYYEDYLTVNDDEMGEYKQVYINQKNDVHPPLYYLLLRIAMSFTPNHFSKWSGIILNIIIYVFITVFIYLILEKLFEGKSNHKIKAVILAFISSITLASVTNVTYIRMYALSTLNILIITYLHMKFYDKYEKKNLILIGIIATIGSLTHYYFLFYLVVLYVLTVLKYMSDRETKIVRNYTITLVIAGIISLIIFPFSIQHMFFGYRGGGVVSSLTDITKWPSSISKLLSYLKVVHTYTFNNLLTIIIITIIGILIYKKIKNIDTKTEKSKYFKILYLPTIIYFILVAISSPWIELRYIMPICALIFVVTVYLLNQLLETVISKKSTLKIMLAFLLLMLISPFVFKIEPQVTYSDKKEIVSRLRNELNVPTVYWFNSNNNRFLDDILLFSVINESYVAKDMESSNENINKIFENKDISKGIIVFINEGQDNDSILKVISDELKLEKITYLKRMNACDIYYISNT